MKNIFKKPFQTIKNNVNIKKSLAVVLGASMLAASFLMGMTYANRDKSENTQALDGRQEEQNDDEYLQSEQGSDVTSSATIANSNTNGNSETNPDGAVKNGTAILSKQFTLATLASYNGLNGAKAYIAYNGKIYDVSNSKYFVNGVHIYDPQVKAGTDITALMNQAPSSHSSKNYIATLPEVGILVKVITENPQTSTSQSQADSSSSYSANSSNGTSGTVTPTGSQVQQFTLATLASYNGLNGAKSYIAYDGKVYDVTSSPYFVNGVHKYDSSVKAGTDITSQMNQAPSSHTSRNYIATLPQVGVLVLVITNTNTPGTTSSSSSQTLPATTIAPIDDDEEEDDEDDD